MPPEAIGSDDASRGVGNRADVVVSARDLTMRFGAVEALSAVNLEVARGELFALIGPDGAGKTTFFRLVAGMLTPTSGTLSTLDVRSLGLVPQRFSLYEDLSVDENLLFRARLYGVPDGAARARAAELLQRVGLEPFGARLAGALSGGMKQKLALVAALLTRPQLLLLDEPTTGVDPVSRREFWFLLNQLHHERLTILVSTPYMDEAEYGTRIGFLDRGRVAALGERADILASYPRALVGVTTVRRVDARERVAALTEVDDVSLFGTKLHVRGRTGDVDALLRAVRRALEGIVTPGAVTPLEPSLEDVFVLRSDERVGDANRPV